jgi:hypothetical protein
MSDLAHALVGLAGAAVVTWAIVAAVMTVIVPRATPVLLTRLMFALTRIPFFLRARHIEDFRRRDAVLAAYAPTGLLMLPIAWLSLVIAGCMLIDWSLGAPSFHSAFAESGSSLFTLGFVRPGSLPQTAIAFIEAALGLGLVALLIAYLPSIYNSYSRREVMVTSLETQAGSPPDALEMIERLARIDGLADTEHIWRDWARWFADIEETHVSTPSLVFFRSPQPERSWVTAAGAVLDAASLLVAAIDLERQPQAELCIRTGYISLRRISDFFGLPYEPDPRPDDPIAINRAEFDAACDRFAAAGAALRTDRDQMWRDFAGWRVNYDAVLLGLASLTFAPPAPWSSDRATPGFRPPLNARRRARRLTR